MNKETPDPAHRGHCPIYGRTCDPTVIATSLPAIAADIGSTSPLSPKLAITLYLLSLAVFIPASG